MNTEEINNKFDSIFAKNSKIVNILLTLHPDPDLDSLGSNFALKKIFEKFFLRKSSKQHIHLIGGDNFNPADFPGLEFMTKEVMPLNYEQYVENHGEPDIFLVLDISRPNRISDFFMNNEESFKKIPSICIDHHASNSFSEINNCKLYLDTSASSTCEIIYDLFRYFFDYSDLINIKDIKQALYLGIYSDTKSFNIAVTSKTLRIASILKQKIESEMDFLVFEVNKNLSIADYQNMSLVLKGLKITKIKGKKIANLVYDNNNLHISKVLEFLSKAKDIDVLCIAWKLDSRQLYWLEFISWLPTEDKIAVKTALCFEGGGHANRAGGRASIGFTLEEVEIKIYNALGEIL